MGRKSGDATTFCCEWNLMIASSQIELRENNCSIQVVDEVIHCWTRVSLPSNGLVWHPHVHTQHSNFITIFQEQERPILCNGGYLVNELFHLRLLGTLDLSLRDVILKGEQSVSNGLRSQEGAVMQVGSTFLWLVPCNGAEDMSAFLFLLVTILLALTVVGSM